jgi:ribosomal protein S12 methylthiotransferase accessory factor
MNTPAFRARFVLERAGPAFVVRSEDETRIVTGDVFQRLIPIIDGKRGIDEIVDSLAGEFGSQKIREALGLLERSGVIGDNIMGERAQVAFWELAGVDPSAVAERLKSVSADILDEGGEGDGIREALRALEIPLDREAEFRVVVARDYFHPQLAEINADALATNRAWMLLRPFGRSQWIGPIFVPGQTACWRCLTYFLRVNGWTPRAAAAAALPTTSAVTQTMAATEAAKWLLGGFNPELVGQIRAIDSARFDIQVHHVLRRPQCTDCGTRHANTLRVVGWNRLVSRLSGIVSAIRRLPNYGPLNTYRGQLSQILRPSVAGWVHVARAEVFGKGCNEQEARLSCLGEAVERYSVQYHGDENRISASPGELSGAIEPALLVQYSTTQYTNGDPGSLLPYPAGERIAWAPAVSLVDGSLRHLPFAYSYMGYLDGYCAADSNGCAAGETIDEAALGGLLELIERDAVAIWWYNRVSRPGIELTDCSDRIAALVEHFEESGRRIHVLDISTDWGIPVSVAVSSRTDGHEVTFGAGAAIDWEESVWRAVAEAAQHTALWQGRPEDDDISVDVEFWMSQVTLHGEPYMQPAGLIKPFLGRRRRSSEPASSLLQKCVQRAEDLHLDVIMLNSTRPEIGVPVARVCVPGLRPWWPRFAPGRLYEVPIKLGWRSVSITEPELNPLAFPA